MKHIEVVCAIIINDENEVFCCKRGPGRSLEGKWEFPGGKVEVNESHKDTIIREIKEELDSIIEPIEYVGKIYYVYSNIDKPFSITMYAYICKLIEGNLTLIEHTEKKWVKTYNLNQIDFSDADKLVIELLTK